jgi:hypothetical protein
VHQLRPRRLPGLIQHFDLKQRAEKELVKLVMAEVEEKWQKWKVEQINCRAADQEAKIANAVRNCNGSYFMSAAMSLGLHAVFEGPFDNIHANQSIGQKSTVLGNAPTLGPSMPTPTRTNPP